MNVTLSSRHAVHMADEGTSHPACHGFGAPHGSEAYRTTARAVTCKKCLKLIADEAEREAAYQARLAASMAPATEANDLGYVAPVDERTETRLTLDEALAEADWIRNDDTCVGLPNWPRPALAETAAAGPVVRCCACGSTEVAYRNTYGQPFCTPCADGNQPGPDGVRVDDAAAEADRICRAAEIEADRIRRAAEIEAEVQRRVASTFRELLAVMGRVTADPKTRVLSGRRSDLKRLEDAGLATLNDDGDLVLS